MAPAMSSPLYSRILMGDCPECMRLVCVELAAIARDNDATGPHRCLACHAPVTSLRLVRP